MEIFINECSLIEQFHPYNIVDSIRVFLKTIEAVNKYNDKTVFKSSTFISYKAIKDTHIESSLKSDFNLRSVFFQNLKNATSWESQQIHENESEYIFETINYTGTSVAEIAERKIIEPRGNSILINFIDSVFGDKSEIGVEKNKETTANVNCAYDEDSIIDWLIKIGIIDPYKEYNVNSRLPPLDQQTVLMNPEFELTRWKNNRRKLYRRIGTNQLWAVDCSKRHTTQKAHIEIFDENTRKHLGTSIYNKIELNTSYCDLSRTVDLD